MAKISRRALASSSISSLSVTYTSSESAAAFATETLATASTNIYTKDLDTNGKRNKRNYSLSSIGAVYNSTTNLVDNDTSNWNVNTSRNNNFKPHTAQPIFSTAATPAPPYVYNKTIQAQILAAERERIRAEFFATYDVMTGVRIAATLGGFFGLMVFLIVWKSRSSSNETLKVLKDPKMAAVAAVCMQEEEEREIQEAMVATGMSIFPDEYDAIAYRRQRMLSLGNVSAPPMLNRGFRFSSVGGGGYSSLLAPPRRFSYSATSAAGSLGSGRRKSLSDTSRIMSHFPMGSSLCTDDYFIESEDELDNNDYLPTRKVGLQKLKEYQTYNDAASNKASFLEVPPPGHDSRRSSSMTCCSTESSYLERRCSAFTLGLSNLPQTLRRKLSTTSRASSTDNWDYYYPDIQVIQPTPKPSPCPSERSINESLPTSTTTRNLITATTTSKTAKTFNAANGKKHHHNAGFRISHEEVIRKHSIAYYDPEKAHVGRGQQIHSISADIADIYPLSSEISAKNTNNIQQGFQNYDMAVQQQQQQQQRRKIALIELQQLSDVNNACSESSSPPATGTAIENNTKKNNTSILPTKTNISGGAAANSSSISMDSTAISIDKLNGSGSLGTISAKALFNAEKRAPLASLSSFKISSIEYPDSEFQSPDEESIFINNAAGDTDEDMQDLSSDSEEINLAASNNKPIPVKKTSFVMETASLRSANPIVKPQKTTDKRFSLIAARNAISPAMMVKRGRRSLLQRTFSASSSDRISLIDRQLVEFSHSPNASGIQSPLSQRQQQQIQEQPQFSPLETHFGSIISTSSSPNHRTRRAQLLQQYSDPQSFPTTTTTEDDTCSTLNTELLAIAETGSSSPTPAGSGTTTTTQPSSLNTVVSLRSDNKNLISSGSTQQPLVAISKGHHHIAHDVCLSTMSDSVVSKRDPIICMPSSLKELILRGSGASSSAIQDKRLPTPATIANVSHSATNLSYFNTSNDDIDSNKSTVILELPLIKLARNESSDSLNAADERDAHEKSDEDQSGDPSLPSSSRKWSKETLF